MTDTTLEYVVGVLGERLDDDAMAAVVEALIEAFPHSAGEIVVELAHLHPDLARRIVDEAFRQREEEPPLKVAFAEVLDAADQTMMALGKRPFAESVAKQNTLIDGINIPVHESEGAASE